MNCANARHDMSRSLDRRLDAVAQRELAEHLMRCEPCKREYHGLRKAMEYVQLATPMRVSPGFRDKLFRRIEAGEGTPDGALRPIIPLRDKVRFFLVGAAAAALILLAAGYFLQGGALVERDGAKDDLVVTPGGSVRPNRSPEGARAGTLAGGGIALRPDPLPQVPGDNQDVLQPVTTGNLASMLLDDTASAYRKLWSYAADARPVEQSGTSNLILEVRQLATRVDQGWRVIHKLSPGCLVADPELLGILERAQPIAQELSVQSEPREIVLRLSRLRELAVPPMHQAKVRVELCPGTYEFVREFLDEDVRERMFERLLFDPMRSGSQGRLFISVGRSK
jgi:hypothetical protein